jgi:hypothetical protein
LFRIFFGKISVGDKIVKMNTAMSSIAFPVLIFCEANQIATPEMAMTNVGDSAL